MRSGEIVETPQAGELFLEIYVMLVGKELVEPLLVRAMRALNLAIELS